MLLSTEIASVAGVVGSYEKALEKIGQAGFDAWDLSMDTLVVNDPETKRRIVDHSHPIWNKDYAKYIRELCRIGKENGIVCNQAHAPFSPKDPDLYSSVRRSLECAAEAGAKNLVFHTMTRESLDANVGLFSAIMPFAEDYGVNVAVENTYLWDGVKKQGYPDPVSLPETMCEILRRVDHKNFVCCVDVGHAEMRSVGTSAPELIRAVGSKLACLHIQDCDLVNDSHALPFTMNIDWDEVIKALRDVDYKGDMTLECSSHPYYFCMKAPEKIDECLKMMHDAARRLADMFEA